jgi:transposase
MFFMPGYSPELNPVELLNHHVKATVFKKRRPHNIKELKQSLQSNLYSIQRDPQKLKQDVSKVVKELEKMA